MQKNLFLIQLRKITFLTPAKSTAKTDPKKTPTLKESDLGKLRVAALFRPLCAEVVK